MTASACIDPTLQLPLEDIRLAHSRYAFLTDTFPGLRLRLPLSTGGLVTANVFRNGGRVVVFGCPSVTALEIAYTHVLVFLAPYIGQVYQDRERAEQAPPEVIFRSELDAIDQLLGCWSS